VSFKANFSAISSSINVPSISLTFPESTRNNQALYVYPDSTYNLAKVIDYLSPVVAGASLLLFIFGYFGCKLQSLEGVAVVQLAALLLMTIKDMGPTYVGLKYLSYSLGITVLNQSKYYYEDSTVPTHIQTLLHNNDSISLINIFLLIAFIPTLISVVLKILSVTVCKDSRRIQKAWKYALGTFTYYGLLFLAYGEFASFALNLRYFQTNLNTSIGLLIGIFFATALIVSVVASYKVSIWYGSFKKKFFKFEISNHFYIFSSSERFFTALLIVCLSPGAIAAGIVNLTILAESIFILAKRPYTLGEWKRPLFNKILAITICLLYVAASATAADSAINQLIPFIVLTILLAVLVVSFIASIQELIECWTTKEEISKGEEKNGEPLTVEEGQKMLMK
jgi:hypothetical protein